MRGQSNENWRVLRPSHKGELTPGLRHLCGDGSDAQAAQRIRKEVVNGLHLQQINDHLTANYPGYRRYTRRAWKELQGRRHQLGRPDYQT